MNPYRSQPGYAFWRNVASCPPGQLDPVGRGVPFKIDASHKVATMGSCFAQHIARHLQRRGLNYFVTEPGPAGLPTKDADHRGYGLFTARFGNVYTVRQALQLFDRAFDKFHPQEHFWRHSGRFVDPFRPTVEPDGFATEESLEEDRKGHLDAVRQMFSDADVIVFTLGLTEGWRSLRDGAVYPLAPGVKGGAFAAEKHEAVNFGTAEVIEDLFALIRRTAKINPNARWILTVSPVPLNATHEDEHVVTATTYSKSVLRVAAEEARRAFDNVAYFPSFEVITSPHAQGRYYDSDLRSVREIGVSHVMRIFDRHFLGDGGVSHHPNAALSEQSDVVCDEEEIERSLSAFAR